jgi:hypothetical protein
MTTKVWQPALNALGRAKGTFKGVYSDTHEKKDGVNFDVDYAYFEVLGEDNGLKVIPVRLPDKYHPENELGQLGAVLGFVYKPTYESTEDGFQTLTADNLAELDALIESKEGTVYTFKMKRNPKGLWMVLLSTMEAL